MGIGLIVGLFSKSFKEDLAEARLEPSRTSMMEPFWENSYGFRKSYSAKRNQSKRCMDTSYLS